MNLRRRFSILAFSPFLLAADPSARLVSAARAQVGVTLRYDPDYRRLPYPNGDVPIEWGVCTDVVIRAYRALGTDLQVLVHEDMKRAWKAYPKLWGMKGPDASIDHRRVPNLATFFVRHGQALAITKDAKDYRPGEVVIWRLNSGVPHIGIVSDRTTPGGTPLILHNIGEGAKEEDLLFAHGITGHYRFHPPERPSLKVPGRSH